MITPNEAYEIIKNKYKFPKVLTCLEYDAFYLFSLAPGLVDTSSGYFTGTTFDAVDKKSGRHSYYDISSDLDAFEKAKVVKIETLLDKEVTQK